MADYEKSLAERVGLFRLSVLGDLVQLSPGAPGIGEALRERAAKDYDIPGTLRRHVAAETIRGWLKASAAAASNRWYRKSARTLGRAARSSRRLWICSACSKKTSRTTQ